MYFSIGQSRFIYEPDREMLGTPEKIALQYENISFSAADGTRLCAWFVPADSSRGTILFCHGNAGNISHLLGTIEILNRLRMDVFVFDYRGYGESGGEPSEQGTYLDAEAAWKFLVDERGIEASEIVVHGRSLGGAIATYLAREHSPKALIVESAFTSIDDIAAKMYPFLPVRLLCQFDYKTVDNISGVECPVLIIHSPDDDLVPFSQGEKLFGVANEPKMFLEISGTHNDGYITSGKTYQTGLDSFLTIYLESGGE